MRVSLIKNNKIQDLILPDKVSGSYFLTDYVDGEEEKLISIEAYGDKWKASSNDDVKIVLNNKVFENVLLKDNALCYLKKSTGELYKIYCSSIYDISLKKYSVNVSGEIIIGSDSNSTIFYNNPFVSKISAKLSYSNDSWYIQSVDSNSQIYVNNMKVIQTKLENGSVVFIEGLKIIPVGSILLINNPLNLVKLHEGVFSLFEPASFTSDFNDIELKNKKVNYFVRPPRFIEEITPEEIVIEEVPKPQVLEEEPAILTLGPQVVMGIASLYRGVDAIIYVISGEKTLRQSLSSILMTISMLLGMLLWPRLRKAYNKKKLERKEAIRQTRYREYLEGKKNEIQNIIKKQTQILNENNLSLEECQNIIYNTKRKLFERRIKDSDFLSVRLGIGTIPAFLKVEGPEEKFSLEGPDNLKELMKGLVKEKKELVDVPVNLSLVEKNILGIISDGAYPESFVKNILLQLMTYHSYEDLKLIILSNDDKYDYLKKLPHCWSDDKQTRFYGNTLDDMKQISSYLNNVFQKRKYKDGNSEQPNENEVDYKSYQPYYLIITDNIKKVRNLEIIKSVLSQNVNIGFGLLIIDNNLTGLPNECTSFINVTSTSSSVFDDNLVSSYSFVPDTFNNMNLEACVKKLANTPIELSIEKEKAFPKVISFLEMYKVGKIEQLNSLERWEKSNPVVSIGAPVGVDENGSTFVLDLHEKFHGPHGLVAGMTGSGKSEFLITYILSMAVNYSPNEVAFVLIDYKGGGLAGAFENREKKIKLPHLSGTITNLDTVEMNRALASIQSELKKRQAIFNKTREKLNESTIDIYKYQRLFREGLVDEPMPHLILISDEFAELKAQQPEFMDQLISTARIGRSLGVHLILATQKPSGVVNDQIWSNSKFKVCLKVQDKSDSTDMIKTADAAMLKDVGRFYLLVGYSEYFAEGQSAWCGAKYIPSEKVKSKVDTSIEFVDNSGYVTKTIDYNNKNPELVKGEELPLVVNYLIDIANKESIHAKKLWLDRIPDFITVEGLKNKYNYKDNPFTLNPLIGEYDDPSNQRQGLLTIPLSSQGNTFICGSVGSGKENLLTTMIYSLVTEHTPDEVNIYILDMGAEILGMFRKTPHVGDVILANDEDRVSDLYDSLLQTIEERKKLFVEYNGSYESYCKNSGQTVPRILVIINNYVTYKEIFDKQEEKFSKLVREGFKYGIIFVITSTNPNLGYRLEQNFIKNMTLQLNNQDDYYSVFGRTGGVFPSNIFGRGLTKRDGIFEYQTAMICENDKISQEIKKINDILQEKYSNSIDSLTSAKIEQIDFNEIDFSKNILISCKNIEEHRETYNRIIESINASNNTIIQVFDSYNAIQNKNVKNIQVHSSTDADSCKKISDIIKDIKTLELHGKTGTLEKINHMYLVLVGLDSFKSFLEYNRQFFQQFNIIKKVSLLCIIDEDECLEIADELIVCKSFIWLGRGGMQQKIIKTKITINEMEHNGGGYIKNVDELIIKYFVV